MMKGKEKCCGDGEMMRIAEWLVSGDPLDSSGDDHTRSAENVGY
jgi:hypothetical protein